MQDVTGKVKALDWRCLRAMACLHKWDKETWLSFKRRQTGLIR